MSDKEKKSEKKVKKVCKVCGGTGFDPERERQCPACDGKGK